MHTNDKKKKEFTPIGAIKSPLKRPRPGLQLRTTSVARNRTKLAKGKIEKPSEVKEEMVEISVEKNGYDPAKTMVSSTCGFIVILKQVLEKGFSSADKKKYKFDVKVDGESFSMNYHEALKIAGYLLHTESEFELKARLVSDKHLTGYDKKTEKWNGDEVGRYAVKMFQLLFSDTERRVGFLEHIEHQKNTFEDGIFRLKLKMNILESIKTIPPKDLKESNLNLNEIQDLLYKKMDKTNEKIDLETFPMQGDFYPIKKQEINSKVSRKERSRSI